MVEVVAFKKKINQDAVNRCKELLGWLEEGSVESFFAVASHTDGSMITIIPPTSDQFRLVAGLRRLEYRILKGMDQQSEELK